MIKLNRKGVVLSPRFGHSWESKYVYNTAVIKYNNVIRLLYRAQDDNGISRVGMAQSQDGVYFVRYSKPIFFPQLSTEAKGVEDPRVTKIGNKFYLTYTAYSEEGIKVGIAKSDDLMNWQRCKIYNCDKYNRNAVLFPQKINDGYVMLHRPFSGHWTTDKGAGIQIAHSKDMLTWNDSKNIMVPEQEWEHTKIGAGAPPIKTDIGWLLFYHGVNDDHEYRLGVAMLDLNDTTKVIYRQREPVLEPEESYEKKGQVPNVVFTCGACEHNDSYYVYYGGADTVIALATIKKKELLNEIKKELKGE